MSRTTASRQQQDPAGRPDSPPTASWHAALSMTGVGAAVLMVFWPVLYTKALIFDDSLYLLENALVRNPCWASAWRLLSEVRTPATVEGYYHPLGLISLMIDYALGGRPENLIVFRATSLLLHVLCAVLVTRCVYVLFRNPWAAGIAGLIFGLHPCSVESIAWLSDRKTLLAGLFSFAAILAHLSYVNHGRMRSNILGLAFYALACMSKPMSVPLPVVLLILDAWPLNRFGRKALREKIPYLALAAVFSIITMISQPHLPNLLPKAAPQYGKAILVGLYNISFYTFKVAFPARVSALYPFPEPLAMSNPEIKWAIAGTVILALGVGLSLRWTKALALGWLGYLILLLPAILVPIQPMLGALSQTEAITADRFTYIAKISLLIPLAGGLAIVLQRRAAGRILAATVAGLCLLFTIGESVATRSYIAKWIDTMTMTRYLVSVSPESAQVQVAFGNVLCGEGSFDLAIPAYERAISLGGSHLAHEGLAAALARQGRLKEAESHLRSAIVLNPISAMAHENLGVVLGHTGRLEEAITEFKTAVSLSPNYAKIRYNFGLILFKHHRLDEAASLFEESIALDPTSPETRYQMGCLNLAQGRTPDALRQWRIALSLAPDALPIMRSLAWILATCDQPEVRSGPEALAIAERAVRLSGRQDCTLLQTLAAAYAESSRFEEAVRTLNESLKIGERSRDENCLTSARRQMESYQQRRPIREPINPSAFYP